MTLFDALILGIVEGITEFLPISSTAHLMMVSRILNIAQSEFVKSFEIVIQFGAIAALLFVFGHRFIQDRSMWKKIVIAFIPTAVIGFLLYKIIKTYLIGNFHVAVWSLIIGGLILILVEYFISKRQGQPKKEVGDITNKQAFVIGTVQALSIIPGVSRSAATIVPALLFGTGRKAATEFSFLLALPTVAAASLFDLAKNYKVVGGNASVLAIGFIASFFAAVIAIKLFLVFIQKYSFTSFGIYRIVISFLFLAFFL